MTNAPSKQTIALTRRPDCVTKRRCGSTVLTVSGCFRQGGPGKVSFFLLKKWLNAFI